MELTNNDQFSKLNDNDLDELLYGISRTLIEYRNTLNLPKNITFGIEIEYEDAFKKLIESSFNKNNEILENKWISKGETGITRKDLKGLIGGEINSPILIDNDYTWTSLKKVCDILKDEGARNTDYCGGHIHLGTQIFNCDKCYNNLLQIWYLYENVIFRFGYGEITNCRNGIEYVASPLTYNISKREIFNKYFLEITKFLLMKNNAISTINVRDNNGGKKNTIEVRCPNGTLNPIIWQNNINFFTKLFLAINNETLDMDMVRYKLRKIKFNNNITHILSSYNRIDLNSALELGDMIFDNNLDKVYFLKQYLKDLNEDSMKNKKVLKLTK